MVESHWPEVAGTEIRYRGSLWALSGDVDVQGSGEILVADASERDDVRHRTGSFVFGIEGTDRSLNPTDIDEHFDHVEWEGTDQYLVVKTAGRTYRYLLERLQID